MKESILTESKVTQENNTHPSPGAANARRRSKHMLLQLISLIPLVSTWRGVTNVPQESNSKNNINKHKMEPNNDKLLSVTEISKIYNLSKYTIYTLITTDRTFPCVNLGPKKNYRIPSELFKTWLDQRLRERQCYGLKVPTAEQLLKIGRK